MSTYQAIISGLFFGAGALAAWRFTADHYQSRLSEATRSANLFKDWWERDSGKMLIAQAELDLIAEQRRSAGRQSRKAQNALFAATTEKLKQCVAQRDDNETSPPAANPAAGDPAGAQRPEKMGRSGEASRNRLTGRGRGTPPTHAVAPQRQIGRQSCPTNRAVQSAPAEHPQPKGM